MALTDGLLALYHLNNDWLDSSGNGHTLAPSYGPSFVAPGLIGSHAASFDGIDDKAVTVAAFNSPSSISLQCWMRRLSNTTLDNFLSKDNYNQSKRDWFQYVWDNGSVYFGIWTVPSGQLTINTPINTILNDGNKHWVLSDYDHLTGLARIFVDDPVTPKASGTMSGGGALRNTYPYLQLTDVNASGYEDRVFHGYLDEAAVWDRVLTADERSQVWNSGAGIEIGAGAAVSGRRRRMMSQGGIWI